MIALLLALLGAGLGERRLYEAIRAQAALDESSHAGAIVVFGAAQYNGVPSPVFKARLDHAFDLEERDLAPIVITTGGSGGDPRHTEGDAGRDYLVQQGVASEKIVSETRSETTWDSVRAVAKILRDRKAQSCVAVSDGFHLYRIKLMFRSVGITAYGSPAPESPIEADSFQRSMHSLREMLIVTLWRLGIRT